MTDIISAADKATQIAKDAEQLSSQIKGLAQAAVPVAPAAAGVDPFIFGITAFVLACFVGYYVVWKVTPALHTPLMSITNAISGIIIIGAMIAVGPSGFGFSQFFGFIATIIAAVNIF
jgi:NAD(P) transhydrogenase subunit alpha